MSAYTDFKAWLVLNAETLDGRSADETADLAIACGLDSSVVNQWKISQSFKLIDREASNG